MRGLIEMGVDGLRQFFIDNIFGIALILSIFSGMALGGVSFYITYEEAEDNQFCGDIEQEIKQQQDFEGNVACYDSDRADLDIPEEIRDDAELRCACKTVNEGLVRWIPIAQAG